MKTLTTIGCLLIATLASAAEESTSFTSQSFVEGKLYYAAASPDDCAGSPQWVPSITNDPPLKQSQALEIARKELAKYTARSERYDLRGIALHRLQAGLWFYFVEFRDMDIKPGQNKSANAPYGKHETAIIAVLMSGRAMPLLTEEELKRRD